MGLEDVIVFVFKQANAVPDDIYVLEAHPWPHASYFSPDPAPSHAIVNRLGEFLVRRHYRWTRQRPSESLTLHLYTLEITNN